MNPLDRVSKHRLQEGLVALYLRLNGYFTTGLLLHSHEASKLSGEIDILGVRFRNHNQEDRMIDCDEYLMIPTDTIVDLIVGEVKGGSMDLQFNESIRKNNVRRIKLLKWIGLFEIEDLNNVSDKLAMAIETKVVHSPDRFEGIIYNSRFGKVSIRPMLFALDRDNHRKNQIRYVNGQTIIDYCWYCFRPELKRISCETDYDFICNWGEQFEDLVKYFKDPLKTSVGSMLDVYQNFGVSDSQ